MRGSIKLRPSIKGQELQDRKGLHKVDYQKGDVKQQVSSTVRSCLRHYRCASFGEWRALLEAFNVSAEEQTGTIDGRDYAGMIYGALTDDGYGIGTPFKSSRIGKDVGYEAPATLRALDGLRSKVADEMARCSSRAGFCERLHDKGVDAVFRLNAAGRIYGVTFIDHEQGIVANGSLLGRNFSANAFEQKFHAEAMTRKSAFRDTTNKQTPLSSKEPFYPNQSLHPLDAILELADVQACEEQQQVAKRKRKRRIKIGSR